MPFDKPNPQRGRRAYLPRRESLILNNAEGTRIAVDTGCLWVTMERDPRDIVRSSVRLRDFLMRCPSEGEDADIVHSDGNQLS